MELSVSLLVLANVWAVSPLLSTTVLQRQSPLKGEPRGRMREREKMRGPFPFPSFPLPFRRLPRKLKASLLSKFDCYIVTGSTKGTHVLVMLWWSYTILCCKWLYSGRTFVQINISINQSRNLRSIYLSLYSHVHVQDTCGEETLKYLTSNQIYSESPEGLSGSEFSRSTHRVFFIFNYAIRKPSS